MYNKKIYQKIEFFRWVSIIGIFCLLVFQLYSLYNTYENISEIVNRSIDEALTKAISNYRTIEIKKIKDPISINFNAPKKKDNKKNKEKIVKDFKELNLSIDEAMYKLNSMILFNVVFDDYKLDSLYNSVLKKRNIFVKHTIVLYKHSTDSILNTVKPSSNYIKTQRKELSSTTQAQLFYKNPTHIVLQKMLWFLVFSILLIFIISYALLYQFRMIYHQKKIESVKRDFVDSMTHELKHPLQGALAMAEVLENPSFVENKELRTNAIKKVKTNLENLGNLLDTIVEKSYSEKSQSKADTSKNNIKVDINEIMANYKIISEKEINFETNYHNLKDFYWYDKTHFPNAIKNLIDNAIKYSNNAVVIKIEGKEKENNLIISIEDNGIGIKKTELNNIFNKFYRIYGTKKSYGFGLGLSYVKWVCDIHNAEISVKSTFGKGSIFTIKTPLLE